MKTFNGFIYTVHNQFTYAPRVLLCTPIKLASLKIITQVLTFNLSFYTSKKEKNCLKPSVCTWTIMVSEEYPYRDVWSIFYTVAPVSVFNMDKVDGSGEIHEKMSDHYKTHNLPIRFECPGNEIKCTARKQRLKHKIKIQNTNSEVLLIQSVCRVLFGFFFVTHTIQRFPGLQDYSSTRKMPSNPFYTTTSNDYGLYSPTVHTGRKCFYGKPQRFGQEQFVRGMYRDYSLNMWK